MTPEEVRLAKVTRPCGGCTACCDLLAVVEIDKPVGQVCPHSDNGCKIYDQIPRECRAYRCAWTLGLGDERDRPDLSGVVVDCREGPDGDGLYALAHTVEVRQEPDAQRAVRQIGRDAGLVVSWLS